ncbi:nitrogen fixation protein [Mesorhizobium sp. RP14(2022)]|uniref:Nitrogen fixation protein n=1 Tax=Mesorhizobium liriopis TaxID=2953882 RepID=A0ABT1CBA8_9HYPH|nr:nitrogen fixation protein [Mesorhizobium liriopis]
MSASEAIGQALSADRLTEALKLALDAVKAKPQDAQARLLLIDLLILLGDYERADKQADAAAKISPVDAVGLSILRGQVRGLDARDKWFRGGAVPAFPGGPSPADEAALRLGLALREKDGIAARAAYEALEAAREPLSLIWNGAPAPDFRDADDRLFHAFEVITTGGAYLWIEFARVENLALEPIRRPRDLAVRRATLTLKSGSAAEVLIPAIYGIASELSDPLRLGRQTNWIELPGGLMAGQGQRCFLVGEEIEPLSGAESIDAAAEEAALG